LRLVGKKRLVSSRFEFEFKLGMSRRCATRFAHCASSAKSASSVKSASSAQGSSLSSNLECRAAKASACATQNEFEFKLGMSRREGFGVRALQRQAPAE
jgi:hypothetical protein